MEHQGHRAVLASGQLGYGRAEFVKEPQATLSFRAWVSTWIVDLIYQNEGQKTMGLDGRKEMMRSELDVLVRTHIEHLSGPVR